MGKRSTGKGAAIGGVIAVTTTALLGPAVLGGMAVGALHHKNLGLTDADKARLTVDLNAGKAAVGVMAHYDTVLPGKVHRVSYEDLVEEPEAEIRKLLAYLELPFEEQCLRFYENERAVRTPSSEQVRQPIFQEALEHWRNYEPWLGPLKEALGPVLSEYPAVPATI